MTLPNDHADLLHGLQRIPVAHAAGPRAKFVYVNDPAMLPRLRLGDMLQMDPDLDAQPNNLVLVQDRANRYWIRIYRQRSTSNWEAAPVDPNYPVLQSDVDGLTVVAVATHRIELLV